MFKTRTEPVPYGLTPYQWDIDSVYQCTWYAYYRALEVGFSAPCWWDRLTKTGSYTNANQWIENYRDPWEVKDPSYTPVAGDILVYDYGEFGHVIFVENSTMTSEYRSGNPDSFRNAKIGDFKGNLIGVLHYPYESVLPVERNENVDQIQTTDESLRIRNKPNLEGEIVGHVQLGYYNVLGTSKADGYTWYEIAKDRYCADITTLYLPSDEDDFIKEFEKFVSETKAKIKAQEEQIREMKEDMKKIENTSQRWTK